jgi:hypothetical protein
MYILLCGNPPFVGDSKDQIFDQIMKPNLNLFLDKAWQNVSTEAKDLISQMMK